MKRHIPIFKTLLLTLSLGAMITSCAEPFDDSAIQSRLNNHETRIVALETICNQMNVNMEAFSKALSTLESDDLITSTTPIVKNGETVGYTLVFSKSGPATLSQDEKNVYLSFGNMTVITIPKDLPLTISFESDDLVIMNPNGRRDIRYAISSAYDSLSIELETSNDLKARVITGDDPHTGVLRIETGDTIGENTQVLVFVSDGHKLVMEALHFEQQVLTVSNAAQYWVSSDPSEITLHFLSNADCHVVIPSEFSEWVSEANTKVVTERRLKLAIARNNGNERSAKVWVTTNDGKLKVEYIIRQNPDPEVLQAELQQERAVLEEWYRDCGGENWNHHENWCSDKPMGEWEGVYTNYGGHVWWISLPRNNMDGKLPEEIWGLRHLEHLYIPGNNLEIRIPDDPDKLSSSFTDVTIGNFSNAVGKNHLVGGLPHSMAKFVNLVSFFAPCMEITGAIPDEIWSLPNLTYLGLGYNHLEGVLSPAIGNAKKLQQLEINSNRLSGPIPEAFGDMESLGEALLGNHTSLLGFGEDLECNHFTRLPESMGKLHNLYTLWIESTGLEGPLPEGFYECDTLGNILIGSYRTKAGYKNRLGELSNRFGEMPYLYTVSARDAGFTGNIPGSFGKAQYMTQLLLSNNNLTGNLPEELADATELTNFQVMSNRLTGEVPARIMSAAQASGWILEPQQEGYGLTFDLYESTDYARDGNVRVLQRATKGRGIDVVLLGDAFCDTDLTDGTYERTMRNVAEQFFAIEPYASFKDCFNIYVVEVVSSNNRYAPGAKRALNTGFGDGSSIYGNDAKCFEYAQKAVGEERMDEVLVIVTLNRNYYAGTCYMYHPEEGQGNYGNGPSIAYFPLGTDADMFRGLVQHEAGGHGFSKLDDEYDYGYTVGSSFIDERINMFKWGWWPNIDFTGDPEAVKWSHFLSDIRYTNEGLGVFEGGATYGKGVWRPTENSIMRYNTGVYNAPSREAIYTRINKLAYGADWQYDYELFVAWDAVNRMSTKAAGQGVRRRYEPLEKPVVTGKSWRDAPGVPEEEEVSVSRNRYTANANNKKVEIVKAYAGNTCVTMNAGIQTTTTTAPKENTPMRYTP